MMTMPVSPVSPYLRNLLAVATAGLIVLPGLLLPAPARGAWADSFGYPGLDGPVTAAVVFRGEPVLAGSFTRIGDAVVHGIARRSAGIWVDQGAGLSGPISSLAAVGDTLFAAGSFASAGPDSNVTVARWDEAAGWRGVAGMRTAISRLFVGREGLVAVNFVQRNPGAFGRFTRIYLLEASTWRLLGATFLGKVLSLAEYRGDLIAGGDFAADSLGRPLIGVARWDGLRWDPLGAGQLTWGYAFALLVQGDRLIAAGPFAVGGARAADDGAVVWDGQSWSTGFQGAWDPRQGGYFESLMDLDGQVHALVHSYSDGRLLKRWQGSAWVTEAGPFTDEVAALLPCDGGYLAAGSFDMIKETPAGFAAVSCGAAPDCWRPLVASEGRGLAGRGLASTVHAAVIFRGSLVVGGSFLQAGDAAASFIARWDGSRWNLLGTGLDGPVYALAVYRGDLIAAGDFSHAGGQDAVHVARWDGTRWSSLGQVDHYTYVLEPRVLCAWRGKLVVGGSEGFDWGVSNSIWDGSSWTVAPIRTRQVTALASFRNDLIVAGSPSDYLEAWDGSTLRAISAPVAVQYLSLAVHENTLYAGIYDPRGYEGRARDILSWDGSSEWQTFASHAPGTDQQVLSLLSTPSGLLAGGEFGSLNGVATSNIALLGSDGRCDPLGGGTDGAVRALALLGDDFVAGGDFRHSADGFSCRFGTFHPEGSPQPVLSLRAAYPCPSHGEFTLEFDLPLAGTATLEAFDPTGRRAGAPLLLNCLAGRQTIRLNAGGAEGFSLPSGVWYLRLAGLWGERTGRIVVVR